MANHASAKKRIRQAVKKTEVNSKRKSRIRTAIRKVYDSIAQKDAKLTKELFVQAESEIMKGVSKGIVKKETASRKVSRISKFIKKSFA